LEYLPGVHVSSARDGSNVIAFRGIYSESNSQILILVNGVPVRNTLFGGKPFEWNMPVKNISHIEVIRGPGSMLYGGDAMTGVINIVLKNGKELKGGDAGTFVGNQNTYDGWMEYGQQTGDFEYSLSLQGGSTEGYKGQVSSDAQTLIDQQFGTHASKAPGFTNNGRDDVDARLDVSYKDTARLRAGYQRFNNVKTGVGAALALDNTGFTNNDLFNVDLSLNNKLSETISNKTTLYFLGQSPNSDINLLPPGTYGGLLPFGAENRQSGFQGTTGLTTQFNYVIDQHTLTVGSGFIYDWIRSDKNQINYLITPFFIQQIPMTEVSAFGQDPMEAQKNRTNIYALMQDEWNFASDWYLTTGFRYDHYSDVEPGLSPRAALVWNANVDLTTKLIYSRAFRPPSFFEKNYSYNNLTIKPETVNTIEFQIEKRWLSDLTTSANFYWFKQESLISSLPTTTIIPVGFFNNSQINGLGVETEIKYRINDQFNASVNYSYHGLPSSTGTGMMPEQMVKGLFNYTFNENWSIGTQFNWIGDRKRPINDPRADLPGYFTTGITVSTKIAKPLELVMRVNNLFDVTSKEPTASYMAMPGDESVLGRTILGQIKVSY
jgi:iron complex outermembrane receptor protein